MKSTLVHLRLPFFVFLLPIFLFGVVAAGALDLFKTILAFVVLHFLVYPASNGFNSYYDKDKGSIGGIKNPPPVGRSLLVTALVLDGLALVVGLWVGPWFVWGIFLYGLFSKAYSWPPIRLKKYPWGSWAAIALGQGSLTFLLTAFSVGKTLPDPGNWTLYAAALLTALFLGGGYPLTQVYQHEEDSARGDRTLSLILGIRGTFLFAGTCLGLSALGFLGYFTALGRGVSGLLFLIVQGPTLVFFLLWWRRVWRDSSQANFGHMMVMNLISSTCMNLFFMLYLGGFV